MVCNNFVLVNINLLLECFDKIVIVIIFKRKTEKFVQ